MIGAAPIADGLGHHIDRGYIYAAMRFSAFIEIVNIPAKRSRARVEKAGSEAGEAPH